MSSPERDHYQVLVDRNVAIPMRDGTLLAADVYRPSSPGRYPTLLQRTPYNKASRVDSPSPMALRAAAAGYAAVVQDVRGRWESDGTFDPFQNERIDGYDTAAWICDQPWANGRIGMWGQSYVGLTQWQAALAGAPGLAAIVPAVTAADYHEGWTYQGGAFELNFNLSWLLTYLATETADRRFRDDPAFAAKRDALWDRIDRMDQQFARLPPAGDDLLRDLAPYYDEWLAHPAHDEFWVSLQVARHYSDLDVAAFNIGGWYDIFLGGTIQNYLGMRHGAKTERARDAARLLIGPWTHMTPLTTGPAGSVDFGIRSGHDFFDYNGLHLRYYDRYLRDIDNGLDDEPPVRIFVMGANIWRDEREWPPARAREVAYFLQSGGRANTLHGDGRLSRQEPDGSGTRPDTYLYNPLDPVPTTGGNLCCNLFWSNGGVFDQRDVETRSDVLVYTSDPVDQPLEVTGPVKVILHAASTAVDTDFTAKLVDVCPCGCARNLTDGIIRARYRHSMQKETPLTPGDVETFEIDLWATSNVFLPGHRIRLEISSSNFPRFDRNPNTGGVIATTGAEETIAAMQTVYHNQTYPSRLIVSIVDGKGDEQF